MSPTSQSGRAISVLIADDDPLALDVLEHYLSSEPDIDVVAAVNDGDQVLHLLTELSADVLLVDVNMPRLGAETILREVSKLEFPPVFVAITALENPASMLDLLRNGSSGYILKCQTRSSIVQAVRDAAGGGTVVSPASTPRLIGHVTGEVMQPEPQGTLLDAVLRSDEGFSSMEKDVLRSLCEGKRNAEIANELSYSESSVKKYVSRSMNRFKATSRVELVAKLLRPPEPETL